MSPKYTVKEFDEIHSNAKTIMDRLKVSPIEVEKAAFVIIKENEPVYEPKPKPVPSGRPRGRPAKAESEKKPKKATVPGRGPGRPRQTAKAAEKTPLGEPKPRGRPPAVKDEGASTPAESGDKRKAEKETTPGTGSKRAKV